MYWKKKLLLPRTLKKNSHRDRVKKIIHKIDYRTTMHIIMTWGIIFIFLHLIETICVNIYVYARHKRMPVKTPIIFQSRDIYGNKFSLTQKLQLFHFTAFFHSFFVFIFIFFLWGGFDKNQSMDVKILISLFTQLSFNYFIDIITLTLLLSIFFASSICSLFNIHVNDLVQWFLAFLFYFITKLLHIRV